MAPDQLTTSHHQSASVIAWDKVSNIKGSHGNWPITGENINSYSVSRR
jgi:hypothetical protein